MSANRSVPGAAVEVILIVPALDTAGRGGGAPDGLRAASSVPAAPASGAPPDARGTGADPLREAGDGTFERVPVAARPWELRLMRRLGLAGAGGGDVAGEDHARVVGDGESGGTVSVDGVPAARLLYAADTAASAHRSSGEDDVSSTATPAHVVVADPVSLTPGRDEATLAPPEALALEETEAVAFVAAANALLADDPIALERGASGRWYLTGLDARALATPPTHFLARREAGAWLPGGAGAAPWRRLMTELQMLWHAHPLNATRAARGRPPLNGIWFWGGAPLPSPRPSPPSLTLVADDPLALALGRHAGVATRSCRDPAGTALPATSSLPASLPAAPPAAAPAAAPSTPAPSPSATPRPPTGFDELLAACATDALLVVEQSVHAAWLADDADALAAARARVVERWLAPAVAAVRDGRAASLILESDDDREARYVPPPRRRSRLARLLGAIGR